MDGLFHGLSPTKRLRSILEGRPPIDLALGRKDWTTINIPRKMYERAKEAVDDGESVQEWVRWWLRLGLWLEALRRQDPSLSELLDKLEFEAMKADRK